MSDDGRKDSEYLSWVRKQRCRAIPLGHHCEGPIEAHHAGLDKGMGLKAPDREAIALCRAHHAAWHQANGPFLGWAKAERHAWAEEQIRATQAMHATGGREDIAW